jgi:DNA-binding transcriptional ArsR family regulator
MSPAPAFPFPGSRVLAAWWRELTSWHPRQFWVAHLLLHRIEALALCGQAIPLDPLRLAVLRALDLGKPESSTNHRPPSDQAGALDRLHLDRPVLASLLRGLAGSGLVRAEADGSWALTEPGREALNRGAIIDRKEERRTFYFADPESGEGRPHFLALNRSAGTAFAPPPNWHFETRNLQECIHQRSEWKARHRFPGDVEAVLTSDRAAPIAELDYRRVILDRPEHWPLVLIRTTERGQDSLLGFSCQPDGWVLRGEAPVLNLGMEWREVFPDLDAPLGEGAWRHAWKAWCHQRALPLTEAEECALQREEIRLVVKAPARFLDRLRVARSDALRNESWLLAGTGRAREAALLDVRDAAG